MRTPDLPREPHPAASNVSARYDLDPPFEWSRATIVIGGAAIVLAALAAVFPSIAASAIDRVADLV